MLNYTVKTNKIKKPIRREDGRVIGYVTNGKFIKHVCESKHMLLWPIKGWAIDDCSLRQAHKLGAKWVLIIGRDTGRRYRAKISDFLKFGEIINRGYGNQRFLELELWEVKEP